MRITCSRDDLSNALAILSRVIRTTTTLPQLRHVLVSTAPGQVHICATDLEIGVVCTLVAEVEREGKMTVPLRTLLRALKTHTQEERITLSTEGVTSPRGATEAVLVIDDHISVSCTDGTTFPAFNRLTAFARTLHCASTHLLQQLIHHIAFAADTAPDAHPLFSSLWIQIRKDDITFAAGSASCCVLHTLPLAESTTPDLYLVSAFSLNKMVELLPPQQEVTLEIDRRKSLLCLHTETVTCLLRLVDPGMKRWASENGEWRQTSRGETRPFESSFPKHLPTRITVSYTALSSVFALRDVPVSCEIQEGADQSYLTLCVYQPDVVQTYTLPVHLKGPAFARLWLNMRSLASVLVLPEKAEWLILSFGPSPSHADSMVLHWVNSDGKEDSSYTYAFAPLDVLTALASPSVRQHCSTPAVERLCQRWRESWQEQLGTDQRLMHLGEEVISLIVSLLAQAYRPLQSELEQSSRHVQSLATRYSGENLIQVCIQQSQHVVRALTIAAFSEEGSHLKTPAGAFHFRASEIQDALEQENVPKKRVIVAN